MYSVIFLLHNNNNLTIYSSSSSKICNDSRSFDKARLVIYVYVVIEQTGHFVCKTSAWTFECFLHCCILQSSFT